MKKLRFCIGNPLIFMKNHGFHLCLKIRESSNGPFTSNNVSGVMVGSLLCLKSINPQEFPTAKKISRRRSAFVVHAQWQYQDVVMDVVYQANPLGYSINVGYQCFFLLYKFLSIFSAALRAPDNPDLNVEGIHKTFPFLDVSENRSWNFFNILGKFSSNFFFWKNKVEFRKSQIIIIKLMLINMKKKHWTPV